MQLSDNNGVFHVNAAAYSLEFPTDRPFVYVKQAQGQRQLELFALSSIHTTAGLDDTTSRGTWKAASVSDLEVVLALTVTSSIWKRKTVRFRCCPQSFSYELEVEGTGSITKADYFGGYYSAHTRWGSGFFYSGNHSQRGFNPEPNMEEKSYFSPREGSIVDTTGVPIPGRGDWFYTPTPFWFGFQLDQVWLGLGVEAAPGQNRFNTFQYHGHLGFHLSLDYEGHTHVAGTWKLPAIGVTFAADEYGALAAHVQRLQEQGLVNLEPKPQPQWWHTPIYCGWGSQCYVAVLEAGQAPNYARQALYETFMAALEEHDVRPGIVVIDDKWQQTYGENSVDTEKWPDLKGFIAEQHRRGSRVLLWLKAWDPEGLQADQCIRNAAGLPIACDPTNPQFAEGFRRTIRELLGADGYDADGFKIDFSARIPSGPGITLAGDAWGLELMKEYLRIIYAAAKEVKSDALIMAHTPHPYLAEVLDMIRLNDINTGKDVNKAMTHRAKVAAASCPTAVIDTDNWPITDKSVWRSYVQLQPELGVPSLYYATHIDSTKEPLTSEDYALIRQSWQTYAAKRKGQP